MMKTNRADNISGYLFIGVAMIIFIMFTLYPVISAVITSLQKYKPFGSEWVALNNYVDAMKSSLFWKSIKNTVVYDYRGAVFLVDFFYNFHYDPAFFQETAVGI